MRRMNEVFALPIETDMLVRDIAYGLLDTADESAIAHAINHIDSLADALEECMNTIAYAATISPKAMEQYSKAIAALAAYRGDK